MATPFDGISSKDGAIIIGGGFGGAAAAVALHKVTECRVFFFGTTLIDVIGDSIDSTFLELLQHQ